jgi:hypothetical protein
MTTALAPRADRYPESNAKSTAETFFSIPPVFLFLKASSFGFTDRATVRVRHIGDTATGQTVPAQLETRIEARRKISRLLQQLGRRS